MWGALAYQEKKILHSALESEVHIKLSIPYEVYISYLENNIFIFTKVKFNHFFFFPFFPFLGAPSQKNPLKYSRSWIWISGLIVTSNICSQYLHIMADVVGIEHCWFT